jgi:hypothetical protein
VAKAQKQLQDDDSVDCWADLVVSILSVNSYSVVRTYKILDGLRRAGLVDPSKLKELGCAEILQKLNRAGYDRGDFMNNLFSLRLAGLGTFIAEHGTEAATAMILARDRATVEKTLAGVYGIGPAVIKNFFVLRGI